MMADIDKEIAHLAGEAQALRTAIKNRPYQPETPTAGDRLVEITSELIKLRRIVRSRDKEHTEGKR